MIKTTIKPVLSAALTMAIIISCSEDEPKPAAVSDISIKTPPTKVLYKSGETLDLATLIVTLKFDNKETEDVEFSLFEENGITISPANGTEITESVSVKITHLESGKSTNQEIIINDVPEEGIITIPVVVHVVNFTPYPFTIRDEKIHKMVCFLNC